MQNDNARTPAADRSNPSDSTAEIRSGAAPSHLSGTVGQKTPSPMVHKFENYELMLDSDGKPIELGRGAMGITYKALDVALRRPVTLKAINDRYLDDESMRLRFLREARAAASVRHPNVATVFRLGRTGGSYFYAGVSVDIRSDLYSLGVTLWVMLAGNTPFQGTPAEIMRRQRDAPLPLAQLSGIPKPVVVLLEKLLKKDPAQRFQKPSDLLRTLAKISEAIEFARISSETLGAQAQTVRRNACHLPGIPSWTAATDFDCQIARYGKRRFWAGGGHYFPRSRVGRKKCEHRYDRCLGRGWQVNTRQPLAAEDGR